MTRQECKQLLMIVEATYPNFRTASPGETLEAWNIFLADYDYNTILGALKIYINSSNSAFAPSVSQLIAMTRKPKELSAPTCTEVWREVRNAIRSGIYHHQEEFEKLSDFAKKCVGESAQLREWAMLESETIDSVIASNFEKTYKAMLNREYQIDALTIEQKEQYLLGGG